MTDVDDAAARHIEGQQVLRWQRRDAYRAAIIVRRRAARHALARLDAAPRIPAITRDAQAIRGRDVDRVTPRDNAIMRNVLPLGTELIECPVAERASAVRRAAKAVANGAIPHSRAVTLECDAVDETPRNAGAIVDHQLLP